ncbi:MAG: LON peptidase substrate-binding domain-containing protein, partial [Prevotella sp.]|nr:LON peptidase substrate-binding domain-containing protein [Prevotella sp.]
MIADIDGDYNDMMRGETPDVVPVLPVRNLVLFPSVVSPILIGRESSKLLIQQAEKKHFTIGVVTQRDPEVELPMQGDLYEIGVYAKVVKTLTLPNGNITAIVQAQGRMIVERVVKSMPYLECKVSPLDELQPEKSDREFKTAASDLRDLVEKYIEVCEDIPDEASFAIKNISNDIMALNFVCSNMPFSVKEKMKLLEKDLVKERLFALMKIVNREINLQNLKADIRNKTREDIDEQQRNYCLQQQIKNMQAEMGNGDSLEKQELLRKAADKKWSMEMERFFYKEADKLDNLNPQSP